MIRSVFVYWASLWFLSQGVVLLIDLLFVFFLCFLLMYYFKSYKHTNRSETSLSRPSAQRSWVLADTVLCRRPPGGNVHFLLLPPPLREEITVGWIINENKLANIKYWKGNVCMLTIKMASEALTCLKERACQPNASPPTYLEFHNTKKKESSLPVLSIVLINN